MILVRGLIAVAAFACFSACSTIAQQIIQEPKVALQGVKLQEMTTLGGTLLIGVEVDNPNPFSLRLDDLTYELEIAGKALSKGQIKESASVAAKAKTVVEIPVPVKFQDLYASAMDLFSKKSSAYRVKGEARFGLITLPFDRTGEMKLR